MPLATRRQLFQTAGVLGAAGALGSVAAAVDSDPAEAAVAPKPGSAFVPNDRNVHLLRRTTYGPTPSLLSQVRHQGRESWIDKQLKPKSIDDRSCDRLIKKRFPELSWTMGEAQRRVAEKQHWEYMISLSMATIARAIWSKRQLFEVMCEFWSNHLNVTAPTDDVWYCRNDYDRSVIRKHALGRFEDMLVASAQHPAMLMYLDNATSTKTEPNENYGRELLELHTVGLLADFSERDMRDSTRIMTGFTVKKESGLFRYDGAIHHTGTVKVLGFQDANTSASGGRAVGLDYLKYLANHPATAEHIAHKLCVRFVSDDPDPGLVAALAQTYLDNGTAIAPVLKQLLMSSQFTASMGGKMKRPFEDLIATMRLLGYQPERKGVTGLRGLYWVCNQVGQAPLAWFLPDGYPDDAASWQSAGTTLNRWNRHLSLAAHWYPKSMRQPPLRSLLPRKLPRTYGAMVDALAKRLVFRTLSKTHKQVVLDLLQRKSSDPFRSKDAAATYRMAPAVALILDSPYHGVR